MTDWQTTKLGEVCTFENGDRSKNYPSGNDYLKSPGNLFINAGNLAGNAVKLNNLTFISDAALNRLSSGKFNEGDIVFCLRGSVGKFALVQNGLSGAIASSLVIVRPTPRILNKYLFVYFSSQILNAMIEKLSGGAAQPNLGVKDLKEFVVPLPPLDEQEQIVELLEVWNEYLKNMDKKILIKKHLKHRLLQELLYGRVRAGKFQDEWKTVKLTDITDLIKDGTHGTHKNQEDGLALLSAKDIVNGTIVKDRSPRLISQQEFDAIHRRYTLQDGDVVLTIVGSIGRAARIINYGNDFTFQRSVAVLRFKPNISSEFMYHLICGPKFQKDLKKRESKGAQGGVYLGEIAKISVDIPSHEEQLVISKILHDADDEIASLVKKRDLITKQRKYLINSLITGRVRLVDATSAKKQEALYA